jgi:hypothetical protein
MPRSLPRRSLTHRKTINFSETLHRRLNMYASTATAAGVAVLALAGVSEAKVVYTETNQVTQAGLPLYIDLNHDGIKDFVLRTMFYRGTSGLDVGLNASANRNPGNAVAGRRSSLGTGYFFSAASALPAGAGIGPERKFPVDRPLMAEEHFSKGGRSSRYSDFGPWVDSGQGVENRYLGLKFVVDGEVHYGWARLSVTVGHHPQFDDVSATLTGYAYETVPNKAIVAGDTGSATDQQSLVEPISGFPQKRVEPVALLAALALGAPGLAIWRGPNP